MTFLHGAHTTQCANYNESTKKIEPKKQKKFSPFVLYLKVLKHNKCKEGEIEIEQCFSTGVPRNPRVPQGSSRGSAKFEKTQHFSLYSFFFNVFTRNLCHFNSAIT